MGKRGSLGVEDGKEDVDESVRGAGYWNFGGCSGDDG